MENMGLYRPRPIPICFDLVFHGDSDILVPGHFPICIWNLVEENSPHGKAPRSKYRLNQTTEGWRVRDPAYLRAFFKQITYRKDAGPLAKTFVLPHPVYGSRKFFYFQRRVDGLARSKAVPLHFVADL